MALHTVAIVLLLVGGVAAPSSIAILFMLVFLRSSSSGQWRVWGVEFAASL